MEGLNHVCMNHELYSHTKMLLNGSLCLSKVMIFKIKKQNLKVKSVSFRLRAHISTLKVLYCKRNRGYRDVSSQYF